MKRLFESVTIRLTMWYVTILMIISLLFSVAIFLLATGEVDRRLEGLQVRLQSNSGVILPQTFSLRDVRIKQNNEAKANIMFGLIYTNLAVLLVGSVGGYMLARRTLRPIAEIHEAQARFTSDASHELRTPLTIMKSEIELMLRSKKASKPELIELLKSNLEEVNKLTALSGALLRLSRVDESGIPLNEKVDVSLAIESTAGSLNIQKRIKLTKPEKPIVIDGNFAMINELFTILIDNAVKYSSSASNIAVNVRYNGKQVSISIKNNGKGILAEDMPHIFDRFYRADTSRTSHSAHAGYGLGLSLAKKIVDLHNGTIAVTSTPGKTTTFTVTLPAIQN